jgi:hypothetical protein
MQNSIKAIEKILRETKHFAREIVELRMKDCCHAELVSASNLTLGAFHYNKENEILKRVQDDRREFLP